VCFASQIVVRRSAFNAAAWHRRKLNSRKPSQS
jgi:hypothetical protein